MQSPVFSTLASADKMWWLRLFSRFFFGYFNLVGTLSDVLENFFGVEKLGGDRLHCMAIWVQTEVGGGIPQSLLVPCCYRKPEGSKEQEREVVPLFRITDL